MMQVNIGKGITLPVNVDGLPANALEHVIYIGLRNVLMDSHASHTVAADGAKYVDNARATAEKKLAALMSGDVRVTSTREGDPVKAEMRRIATPMATAALMKKHGLTKKSDVDAKELRNVVNAILDSDKYAPGIRVKAEAALKDRAALSVNVDDLEIA